MPAWTDYVRLQGKIGSNAQTAEVPRMTDFERVVPWRPARDLRGRHYTSKTERPINLNPGGRVVARPGLAIRT
jgi:hypothetical protein